MCMISCGPGIGVIVGPAAQEILGAGGQLVILGAGGHLIRGDGGHLTRGAGGHLSIGDGGHLMSGDGGQTIVIGQRLLAAAISPALSATRWPIVAAGFVGVIVSEPSVEKAVRG